MTMAVLGQCYSLAAASGDACFPRLMFIINSSNNMEYTTFFIILCA